MISKNHITRLSKYKAVIKQLKRVGMVKAFAENIADASGVTSAQIRKDFSIFGIIGNKKGGYVIDELIEQIENLLGVSEQQNIILVGYGNIGMALAKYPGFEADNIKIVAAFDEDISKSNKKLNPPVYHIDELEDFIKKTKIELAILAVPELVVQDMFDLLVSYGLKGILNFSSTVPKAGDDVYVNNMDVRMALETVIFYSEKLKSAHKRNYDKG